MMNASQTDKTAWQRLRYYLRIGAILIGIPVLVHWAGQDQAIGWHDLLNRYVAAGALMNVLALVLYAKRFQLILILTGIQVQLVAVARICALSVFYHFFVPFAVGADITKFVKLRGANNNAVATASAIAIDHVVGFAGLAIIAASIYAMFRPVPLPELNLGLVLMVLVLTVLSLLLVFRVVRRKRPQWVETLTTIRQQWPSLMVALGVSLIFHLMQACGIALGAEGWNIDVSFVQVVFVMTAAFMFNGLPLNVAGVGAIEATGVALYLAMDVPLAAAVLLVSLPYSYRLLVAIIGGLWDLLPTPAQGDGTSTSSTSGNH